MEKNKPVTAFFFHGGSDVQEIPENCPVIVFDSDVVNGKTDFMLMPHVGKDSDPYDIFPGPFKEF
jgi:hypothetical protein